MLSATEAGLRRSKMMGFVAEETHILVATEVMQESVDSDPVVTKQSFYLTGKDALDFAQASLGQDFLQK